MMMDDFVSVVLMPIISTALTAIIGYIGVQLKKLYERKEIDKTKKAIAKTCVEAVEQLYKDLHGEEKFWQACNAMTEMLAERGINVSDLEIRMLIESAVQQLNVALNTIKNPVENPVECSDCTITYAEGDENAD